MCPAPEAPMLAYMYNHMSWGWGILMMLGWVVLLGLFVALVVNATRGRQGSSAREVLDRRFAAGDMSVEEYQQARAAMSRDASDRPAPG